jgi:hypothetical protein
MLKHEGEFPRGARLHCRVGDELPMVARHAEASGLEALQQERIWLAQLGAASTSLRSPARAEGSAGMAMNDHPTLQTADIRSPALSDWAEFPPIKSC